VDDLQSEKEQIEEIRAWWKEYGRYVIAGILIAVGLMVGFNQYKSSRLAAQLAASELYETLTVHVDKGELDDAVKVADELANDYANTAYAAQSKLAMARLYMDKNRDQDAAGELSSLIAMRGNRELKLLGRLRLARVLLYQEKPQEVVDLLASEDDGAFRGLYAEALGDAYAQLGRADEAADAYTTALADTTQSVNRGLVQMKLNDLPAASAVAASAGAGATPAAAPAAEDAAQGGTEELPQQAPPARDEESAGKDGGDSG
jgi:predicted negative regulator of RcsB-dependent stress response